MKSQMILYLFATLWTLAAIANWYFTGDNTVTFWLGFIAAFHWFSLDPF